MPSQGWLLHALLVAVALPSCASVPPPPPDLATAPAPETARLERPPAPPPAGFGIVVFDSVSGPASVSRVVDRTTQWGTTTRPLAYLPSSSYRGQAVSTVLVCDPTPCVGYLPFGDHEIILESADGGRRGEYVVSSSEVPRALRASLDLRTPASAKRPIGLAMLVPGLLGVAIGVGLVAQQGQNDSGHQAGAVVIGVSGLVTLIGGILFATGHPAASYDGQGTVWDLKATPPPPPATQTGATQL